MGDLKLYGKNDYELEGLLRTVKTFSDDIGMTFGLDKCAKATFIRRKLKSTSSIVRDIDTKIKELDQEETYKCLGIEKSDGIQHKNMKEKIRKECYRRVREVLQSELNTKNKLEAINTLAIPVVSYTFNVVNWNLEEIKRIDRKIRKSMTLNRMHHPEAELSRMYIPRTEGGRGMINLEMTYKTTTIGLNRYLKSSEDRMLHAVLQYKKKKKLHSVVKESRKFKFELNIAQEEIDTNMKPKKAAKDIKKKAKNASLEDMKKGCREKPLHGKYPLKTDVDVNKATTHQWLSSSCLKGETEGFILAAQDQSISTGVYQTRILKNGTDPNCRPCTEQEETVDHKYKHVL